MCNRLIIIGAGGHGKVIADIALKLGYSQIAFADDFATGTCMELPILCKTEDLESYNDGETDFVIGIGNNAVRKKLAQSLELPWVTLIHPGAHIGVHVELGAGTVVMAGAAINPCATVGKHCILNTGAVVEHDNQIGDYVHISPNAAIGGTVKIGDGTHIGIGAAVKNNVEICPDCVIGAGGVVVKDIFEPGVYVGVPVKSRRIMNG